MAFVITYHDECHANSAGVTIVGKEAEVREAIERLRREGYEVTSITPPLTNPAISERSPLRV
jgi:lysylphosphatidylglycerol synthetase-like protein (DUF2156 family)